jgi:integrase
LANTTLKLVSPETENRTVTPLRRPNAELRLRDHLTEREIDKLVEAAKANRWGQRDSTIILIAGLRPSELCGLHERYLSAEELTRLGTTLRQAETEGLERQHRKGDGKAAAETGELAHPLLARYDCLPSSCCCSPAVGSPKC